MVPFLVRAVFDDALFPLDGGPPDLGLLGWLVAGMCVIPIVTALIGIGQNWLTSTVGNSAMADLRGELFAHLQKMELAFFTATKTGAIQSRLANDVAGVRTVLTDTATTIVQNSVTVTAALVVDGAAVVAADDPDADPDAAVRVAAAAGRPASPAAGAADPGVAVGDDRDHRGGAQRLGDPARQGLQPVAAGGRPATARPTSEQTRLQVEQAMTGRTFFAIVQTFFAITPALIYLVAGWIITGRRSSAPTLTAGTLVAFTTLQARLQMPLLQLMRVTLDVQTSLALFRRIFEYLDLEPAIKERPGAVALDHDSVRGRIELRDVWFRYPEPRELSGTVNHDRFGDSGVRIGADEEREEGSGWALRVTLAGGRARAAGRDRGPVRRRARPRPPTWSRGSTT